MGFIGMGRIGLSAAKRFKGFGCDVIYSNRSQTPNLDAFVEGFKHVEMDELLETSDFVVAICAYTPETKGLIDETMFRKVSHKLHFCANSCEIFRFCFFCFVAYRCFVHILLIFRC